MTWEGVGTDVMAFRIANADTLMNATLTNCAVVTIEDDGEPMMPLLVVYVGDDVNQRDAAIYMPKDMAQALVQNMQSMLAQWPTA